MKYTHFVSALILTLVVTPVGFAQSYDSAEEPIITPEIQEEANLITWPSRINLFFPEDGSIEYISFENPEIKRRLLEQIPQHQMRLGRMNMWVDVPQNGGTFKSPFAINRQYHEEVTPTSLTIWLEEENLLPEVPPNVPEVVQVVQTAEGTVEFSGAPIPYHIIDIPKLTSLINGTKGLEVANITVPMIHIEPSVKIDKNLEERGIKEVIGIGHSDFKGSSADRVTNIYAAMAQIHGSIIKKDEEFSFNDTLGSVSPELGFVPELVILGDKLEKELGGGTCQVSTTVYRGALETGLPITKRRSHSFVVPYYGEVGLDATIYLGGQDLMFANDTPGDILIQQYAYGTQLYTIVYGTSDNRTVAFDGPYKYNYRGIPAATYTEVDWLSPGKTYRDEGGKSGLDARWTRIITKNPGTEEEEIIEEDIYSRYRAKAPKILIGRDPNAAPVGGPQTEALAYVSSNGKQTTETMQPSAPVHYGPSY